jgi:hypothetical protein
MERCSNHADQQERLETLVARFPTRQSVAIMRTTKQVQRRLGEPETVDFASGLSGGATVKMAERYQVNLTTVLAQVQREGSPSATAVRHRVRQESPGAGSSLKNSKYSKRL